MPDTFAAFIPEISPALFGWAYVVHYIA